MLCCKKYSYAIPDNDAIQKIAKYSPLIEIGAGSGYWSYLLQNIGVDIIAYDNKSWGWDWKTWCNVQEGDHSILLNVKERNLFLCWPDYDTSFAYDCLKNFKGKYFIYIGEGSGGCTGDDQFFELLYNNFEIVDSYDIPQWAGIRDYLQIYKRLDFL